MVGPVGTCPVPSSRVFIKVCGITNEEDALLAVAVGADALGFVFAPGSPRQVTPGAVRDMVRRLPPETVTVGVFRDERPERVVEIVNAVGLSGAQLHGREPLSEVRTVRRRVPFVIQGFAAGDAAIGSAANGPADVVRGRSGRRQRARGGAAGTTVGRRRVEWCRDVRGVGPQGCSEAAALRRSRTRRG